MMSGSRGGSRSAARIRKRSPERNSMIAATTGSSAGRAVGRAVPGDPSGPQNGCPIETSHASCDREVGHRVLDRVLQVLALAAQPFFEDADVSRPESAGHEELASGRQRNGEIHRRKAGATGQGSQGRGSALRPRPFQRNRRRRR